MSIQKIRRHSLQSTLTIHDDGLCNESSVAEKINICIHTFAACKDEVVDLLMHTFTDSGEPKRDRVHASIVNEMGQ